MTRRDISTKMGNINGEKLRMNYINANNLVRLYDVVICESGNEKYREGVTKGAVKCVVLAFGNTFPRFGIAVKVVVLFGVGSVS